MIAGASWGWWLGFHAAVLVLLLVDAFLPAHRGEEPRTPATAWWWTAVLVAATAVFALWIALGQSRHHALEFVAGYAIETSLSVDNLFVFLVIFEGFRISRQRQHTALLWGVAGAVVLRALFIAAGVSLIHRFDWISWIFGLFLLIAAFRMVRGGSATGCHSGVDSPPAARKGLAVARDSCRRSHRPPVCRGFDSGGARPSPTIRSWSTPQTSPRSSGLRSLYFALAALLDRLRYLHYGLGAMLGFVAFKMLASRWLEVPITISLAMMGAILAVCACGVVDRRRTAARTDQQSQIGLTRAYPGSRS